MNTSRLAAAWLAVVCGLAATPDLAKGQAARPNASAPSGAAPQGQAPPAAPAANAAKTRIAVLDLGKVLKEYNQYLVQRDQLMTEVVAIEERARQQGEQLRGMAERLKDYNKGTPEFNKLESEITNMQADLQVQQQLQQRDIVQRQAKQLYAAYQDIKKEIQYLADQYGIGIVMRSLGEPADTTDANQVAMQLDYPLLWSHSSIDITQMVIEQLNRNHPAQRPASATAQKPAAPGANPVRPR